MCLLLVALVMSWAACASPDSPTPEATPAQDLQPVPSVTHNAKELFEQNQARWEAQNLRDYQFTFRRQVTGSTESTGPVVITVSNGHITGARAAVGRGLGTIDPDQEDLYVIDSLFAYLGQVLEAGVDSLVIRYDAEFGFPYFAYVDDQDHEHTTAETTFEVRDFFPLVREVSTDSLRAGA